MSPRASSALKRGQPSSPASPEADNKKIRRSELDLEGPAAESSLEDVESNLSVKAPESMESTMIANTMSPPSRPDRQRTPASSPGPAETQGSTQVASQFYGYSQIEEYDENVWGYLDPISDDSRKSIKLNKKPQVTPGKKIGSGATSNGNPAKTNASGFLIGRHPECDLHIEARVISNRHCVIYKEIAGGNPKAVLEDLSSNGTWVNSVIVGRNKRRELENGDVVEFAGGHKYNFRYPTSMASSGFRDAFELGAPLGSGHFATVYQVVEKTTGNKFAVKVFKKRPSDSAAKVSGLQQEIAMLMSVAHPNVLCLKATYDEEDGTYLVLELAPEGELFNYIIKKQKLTEKETRHIFKQLLEGLKYLHERNIVHRDIKPENILLTDKALTVKLADFGLAKIIGEDSFTTSLCGTPSYVAPEILASSQDRHYTKAVDVWSLGVVLYICLCGFPPFSDELYTPENPFTLSQQIKNGRYDFPSPYWDTVQDSALDLIEKMLEVDPDKRITIDEALHHPWMMEDSFSASDSCSNLAEAIQGLGFKRRKIIQERTLLAEAPGLANPTLQNPSKVKVQIVEDENGVPRVELREGDAPAKAESQDPQTKAFIAVGGIDETLYPEDSYEVVQSQGVKDSDDNTVASA